MPDEAAATLPEQSRPTPDSQHHAVDDASDDEPFIRLLRRTELPDPGLLFATSYPDNGRYLTGVQQVRDFLIELVIVLDLTDVQLADAIAKTEQRLAAAAARVEQRLAGQTGATS